jgi:acyl-coenzyme A thioesterase PaaI-like protein
LTSDAPTVGVVAGPGVTPFEVLPHNCFACGSLNATGLRLLIHVEPGRAWTEATMDARFEGWAGITHGGILATVLDEVMAWSLVAEDNWGLTARLAVDFKQPVKVGQLIRAEGRITASRRRVVRTAARVVDARNGALLATAEGTYVAAAPARKQELRDRYGFRVVEPGRVIAADTPVAGATRASAPTRAE